MSDLERRIKLIGTTRPSVCSTECPLHPKSRYHNPNMSGGHVPPKLSQSSSLLVVGIVPGEEEELGKEPFIGPSGRYLNHALQWAGGSSTPLAYTKVNLVNCRTVKPGRSRAFINRTPPTAREMRCCYQAFLRPLLKQKWDVVALFGTDVYKFMIPEIELREGRSMKMFDVFGKAIGHRLVLNPEHWKEWYS